MTNKRKFKVKIRTRNIEERLLIEDLKSVAKKIGKESIARREYETYGKYSYTTIRRRFGSWYTALEKANLNSSRRKIHNPIEDLLENIANVWVRLGKQPSYQSMNQTPSEFSAKTYDNRFGSWNNALMEFAQFIEKGNLPEEVKISSSQNNKNSTPRRINWRLRAQILIRDNCICQMCGASPAKNPNVQLHVDHIIPWSKGGETLPENLQTLCSKCNIGKSDLKKE